MKTTFLSAIAVLAVLTTMVAHAEQRALLVGVGRYDNPEHNLPGIDLDLQTMEDTLQVMGFEPSQIHSLLDEQATAANVEKEIASWLTDGVRPQDRVIFYFSGHGSYVPDYDGDEPDGVDEVLVTHDVRKIKRDGKRSLSGVVVDDVLNKLLSEIPSKNIMTIVDACHSGTSTRSFIPDNRSVSSEAMYSRTFTYEGMPEPERNYSTRGVPETESYNYVSISAADDDELAIGGLRGGMFTLGLSNAIVEAAKSGSSITVQAIRDRAAEFIEAKLDKNRVHHPQVTGNPDLAAGSLQIIPLANGNGPKRKRVESLVSAQESGFELQATKQVYVVDEPVEFILEIPGSGYLNVVSVDSEDNATVLFPNQYHLDNAVTEGTFTIPTKRMTFELPASEPLGTTLVAAFVTKDPVHFYNETLEGRDADGNISVDFASLSGTAVRAIKVAQKATKSYAAMIDLMVVAP